MYASVHLPFPVSKEADWRTKGYKIYMGESDLNDNDALCSVLHPSVCDGIAELCEFDKDSIPSSCCLGCGLWTDANRSLSTQHYLHQKYM